MTTAGDISRRVSARCGITSNNPLFTDGAVLEAVSDALLEFSHWPVNVPWTWLLRDVTVTLAAGASEVSFDALTAAVPDNAVSPPPEPPYPVFRVLDVCVVNGDGTTTPLQRLSRAELRSSGLGVWPAPAGWTAERGAILVDPAATSDTTLSVRVVIDEVPLTEGAQSPLLPDRYLAAWTTLGRAYVYEMKQDDTRAKEARDLFEKQARQALWHSRPVGGPGKVPLQET